MHSVAWDAINNDGKMIEMRDKKNFHKRSQDLPSSYHDAGQFYIASTTTWLNNEKILETGIPYILSKKTDVSIVYPSNITDKRQINIYKKTYDKKIKERRSKKIKQSQTTCILVPVFGLLALLFSNN